MPVLLRSAPYYGHRPSRVEYFGGSSPLSALSPHVFHVSLAGRSYMVDFSQPFYRQYRRQPPFYPFARQGMLLDW